MLHDSFVRNIISYLHAVSAVCARLHVHLHVNQLHAGGSSCQLQVLRMG